MATHTSTWRTRTRAAFLTAAAGLLAAGPFTGIAVAAHAADPAPGPEPVAASQPVLTLDKSVQGAPSPLVPGSAFSYHLTLSCSSLRDSCINAVLQDTLPPEFDVGSLPPSTPTREVTYDPATRKLTVRFLAPLASPPNPAGSVGVPAGTSVDLDIPMTVPTGTDLKDGQAVTNTATAKADNADPAIGSVTQTVTVPKSLDAKATKSWNPNSDVAGSHSVSTVTLGVANTSSSSSRVSPLAVTDASPGLFDNYDLVGLGPVTRMPAGADQVTVLVCTKPVGTPCSPQNDSDWIRGTATAGPGLSLPAGVGADQVTGIRLEFTDSAGQPLPYDAAGAVVPFTVRLRDTVRSTGAAIDPAVRQTVTNCATPAARNMDRPFTVLGEDACTNHDILPNIATVSPTKKFFPDSTGDFSANGKAVQGQNSGVSAVVTAKNTSPFPVRHLTITEPSGSTPSALDKMDVTTVRLTFPQGAVAARLTVTCRSGTVLPEQAFSSQPAAPVPAGCPPNDPPAKISVTYDGVIAQGANAVLGVHGTLNSKVTDADVAKGLTDCADASASNPDNGSGSAAGTACATLPIEAPNINGGGAKVPSQTEIPPGQPVTYQMYYANNGNVFLPNVVLTDPPDPAAPGNPFDSLRITDVTTDSSPPQTLVVELYDPSTKAWVVYRPGDTQLLGIAKGVRLTSQSGIPVDGFIRAHITVQLRDGITSGTVQNCFVATVDGKPGSINGGAAGTPSCSTALDVTPPRTGASVNKSLSPATVPRPVPGLAPTDVTVRLTAVNTGNLSLKRLVLTDTDPGFFDAVTFTGIAGVTFPAGADRVQIDACTTGCHAVPPVFVDGTPTGSEHPGLPAGVTAADVQGLRVTFSSSTGGYDLTPATGPPQGGSCPGSTVCFTVQPRDTLRSNPATPIPDTIPDTVAGGGESRLQPPGQLFPIPEAHASLQVSDGTPRLKVVKSPPEQVMSPGNPAQFTLTTTNTGTAPIRRLVIGDGIPAGLLFDDSFIGTGGLPFTIEFQNLPPGQSPPHVSLVPRRDGSGAITRIDLAFEDGFVFYPNSTIAVTFQVKLAGGVAAGTVLTNTYGAGSAVEPKLECDPASYRLGVLKDDPRYGPGTYCTSSADVTARAGVSFEAGKWSTGDPTLGFRDTFSGQTYPVGDPHCPEMTLDGRSYTRYPCIALVYPGQNLGFALQITNAGTEPASRLRLLDVLPAPGDTGVLLGDQERETAWDTTPPMTGPAQYIGPGTADLQYTKTPNPCGRSIATPRRNCTGATDWTATFPGGSVRGVDLDAAFPAGLAPNQSVYVVTGHQAPTDLSVPDYPAIAWNSFAHTETTNAGEQPVAEPPKAGVGLVFGNIRVDKVVADPPQVPVGPFTAQWVCTVTTADGQNVDVRKGTDTFGVHHPLFLVGIPAGAVCRIWESDAAGGTSGNLGEANAITVKVSVATGPGDQQKFTITNQYPRRSLIVGKRVTGPAANEVGKGPFTITVDCSFGGTRLPGFPATLVFTGNDSHTFTDLPKGSVCDVEETDAGGATRNWISVLDTGRADVKAVPPGRPGDTEATGAADDPAQAQVVNEFDTGGLRIVKRLTGPGANPAGRVFGFHVSCSFNGKDDVVRRDVELRAPDFSSTLTDLPVGATCSVTETASGGADGPAEPVDGLVIASGPEQTVTATLTNHFAAGRLALLKRLTGAGAAAAAQRTKAFPLRVTCTLNGSVIVDHTYQVPGGTPFVVPDPLPLGARCWVAEPRLPGVAKVTVDHGTAESAVVITGAEQPVLVTVTNAYEGLPPTGADLAPLVLFGTGSVLVGGLLATASRRRSRLS